MSSQGGGKARDKRPHRSTPYQRPQSLLGRLGGTVSRLLPQSWVPGWLREEEEAAQPAPDLGRAGPSGVATRRHHLNAVTTTTTSAWEHSDTDGIPVDDLSGIQLEVDSTVPVLPSPIVWPRPPLSAGSTGSLSSPPVVGAGAAGPSAGPQLTNNTADTSAGLSGVLSRPVAVRGGAAAAAVTSGGGAGPSEQRRAPAGLEESLARKRRRRQHVPEPAEEDGELSEDSEPLPEPAASTSLNTSSLAVNTSRPQPSALRNKRPRFNPAALNASLMSQDGNTSLNRSAPGNSPLYPGPTVYGGAASHRRLRLPPPTSVGPYQVRARPVQLRAAGGSQADVPAELSTTARRILSVLEHMSTPVADARRMALPSPGDSLLDVSFSGQRRAGMYGAHGARLGRRRGAGPPVHRVVSPVKVAVEPNRSRPPQRAAQSPPAAAEQEEREKEEAAARRVTFSAPPAAASTGGKMRRPKERGHYSSRGAEVEEPPPSPLHLPDISLPISGNIKPFSLSSSTPKVSCMDSVAKRPAAASEAGGFSFASPQPVTAAGLVNGLAELDTDVAFTFSAPRPVVAPSAKSAPKSSPGSTPKCAAPAAAAGSLMDKFRPAAGTWECSVCMISNKPDAKACIACQAAAPGATSAKPAPAPAAPPPVAPAPVASSWGDKFKPATGQWTCDTCMLSNKPEAVKCPACETPKPAATPASSGASAATASASTGSSPAASWGGKFKPAAGEPPSVKAAVAKKPPISATPASTPPAPVVTPSWGDKFKPVAGEWTCDTCMLKNKPDATKCVACETPNANAKSSPAASSTLKPSSSEHWECSTCLVRNQASVSKCIACESPRPGNRLKESSPYKFGAGTAASGATAASGGFSFGFSGPSPSASSGKSTPAVSSGFAVATQSASTGFTFGFTAGASTASTATSSASPKVAEPKPAATATPAVQFSAGSGGSGPSLKRKSTGGERAAEKPAPELRSGSIMDVLGKSGSTDSTKPTSSPIDSGKNKKGSGVLPANGGLNLFPTSSGKDSAVPAAAAFMFGTTATASESTPAAKRSPAPSKGGLTAEMKDAPDGGFSFGAKAAPASSEKPATSATFTFGSTTSKSAQPDAAAAGATPAFGAKTSVPGTAGFTFGSKATESSEKPSSGFSFGTKPATEGAAKPSAVFSFGAKTSDASVKPSTTGFSFGTAASSTDKTPSATFAFGSAAEKSDKPAATFTFGSSSVAPQSTTAKPSAAVFSFGSSSSSADSSSSKPASAGFSFGAVAATTSASEAKPASAGFAFGAPAASKSGSSAAPFGASSVNGPSSGPAVSAPGATPASGVFQFGSSAPAPAPAAPFGGAPAAAPFAFSAKSSAATAPTSAAPASFAFGAAAAPATTSAPAAGVFAFGSGAAPAATSAPFTFGASAPAAAAPSGGVFAFGAAPAAPAAGAGPFGAPAAAPTPAFGAAAPAPSAGFSFGAAPSTPQFNFSSGQPPAAGIFQFGATSSTTPAVAPAPSPFGAAPAPAAANPFSATVPGGGVAGRKIRTARRRGVKK